MDEYVSAVCADIAANASPPAEGQAPLRTVFFGGGTPSLLPPTQLARILDALRAAFGIAPDAEVSMEMDPGASACVYCDAVPSLRPALLLTAHSRHVRRRVAGGVLGAGRDAREPWSAVFRRSDAERRALIAPAHHRALRCLEPQAFRAAQAAGARTPPMT
jgi:hypothetical protein